MPALITIKWMSLKYMKENVTVFYPKGVQEPLYKEHSFWSKGTDIHAMIIK